MMEKVSRTLNVFNLPETGLIFHLEFCSTRSGLKTRMVCLFKISVCQADGNSMAGGR